MTVNLYSIQYLCTSHAHCTVTWSKRQSKEKRSLIMAFSWEPMSFKLSAKDCWWTTFSESVKEWTFWTNYHRHTPPDTLTLSVIHTHTHTHTVKMCNNHVTFFMRFMNFGNNEQNRTEQWMKKSCLTQNVQIITNLLVWKVFRQLKFQYKSAWQECKQYECMHTNTLFTGTWVHTYTNTNKFLVWKVCSTSEV